MAKQVIRFDLEVDTEDQDKAGEMINQLIGFSVDVIEPEHYQWRVVQVDEGLEDPNLEKLMAQATMVG